MSPSGVNRATHFTPQGELQKLAPALLALFPKRVMLNSRELASVVRLESGTAPISQLVTWANELLQKNPQLSLNSLLHQLAQRALRWQSAHVGDKYGTIQIDATQLDRAFDDLITEVKQAEAEAYDTNIREVIAWIISQLDYLKHRTSVPKETKNHLSLDTLLPALRHLELEAQERIFIVVPAELKTHVHTKVQNVLKRESHRARPQDFVIAQKSVWWSMMRYELNLPPLRLCLFDGW